MFNEVRLENFGPLKNLKWPRLGSINLIIGKNSSGKTFILKALYAAIKTIEAYKRGDNPQSAAEILADKLHWTFQADKIGDLVTKGSAGSLSFMMEFNQREFRYRFGKDTTKQIASIENHVAPRTSNSIFLPAKEVLSIHHVILKSREQDKVFGFDDTYLDLARSLRQSPKSGRLLQEFSVSREKLENMVGGQVQFEPTSGRWIFKKGNQKFPIGVTAEGIKKIAILDTLLTNRYLDKQSIIFIDEPEAALHPEALVQLLDIVSLMAERGIQFFMASHSYFVVKKLHLLAQEKMMSIPILCSESDSWRSYDLGDGMPDNPIIDQSIKLYEKQMEMSLS